MLRCGTNMFQPWSQPRQPARKQPPARGSAACTPGALCLHHLPGSPGKPPRWTTPGRQPARAHPPTCPAARAQPVTFAGRSWWARLIHAATAAALWASGRAGLRGGGSAVRAGGRCSWCHWVPADSLRGGKGGRSLATAARTVTSREKHSGQSKAEKRPPGVLTAPGTTRRRHWPDPSLPGCQVPAEPHRCAERGNGHESPSIFLLPSTKSLPVWGEGLISED